MPWGTIDIRGLVNTYYRNQPPGSDNRNEPAVDSSVDLTRAHNYITDYYATYDTIIDDLGEAAHDAILNFFLYSSIDEKKVDFSILDLLFEVAFAVLPGEKFAQIVLTKAKKFYQEGIREMIFNERNKARLDAAAGALVKTAEEEAKKQVKGLPAKDSDEETPNEFAAKAIDEAGKWARALTGMVTFERLLMRNCLDLIYDQKPERRGHLQAMMAQEILGPQPTYDPASIEKFQRQYELGLYRKYYSARGSQLIVTYTEYHKYLRTVRKIQGIPSKVLSRVKDLEGAATEDAGVIGWSLRTERREINHGTTWDDHH